MSVPESSFSHKADDPTIKILATSKATLPGSSSKQSVDEKRMRERWRGWVPFPMIAADRVSGVREKGEEGRG